MSTTFASNQSGAIPLHVIHSDGAEEQLAALGGAVASWAKVNGFSGALGTVLMVPSDDGIACALAGYGTVAKRARGRFHGGKLSASLAPGTYTLSGGVPADEVEEFALGWLLGSYRFDRYAKQSSPRAELIAPEGIDAKRVEAMVAGEFLTRDLINTPASDMGPSQLEVAARDLAAKHGAAIEVTEGQALLDNNFPMIHAVGRASADAPRLIDMRWGDAGPQLTLVGKGVCFDTGGLNLKPGVSMGLMKKDMGGAATVLGLAHMIMALGWPVRLRVLVPAVENSVSANSFRPQDILPSRKGLTVEINNTDAEGRLVLADALALADEESPECIISMATLTGAARVAVGPDLAPFYSTDEGLASGIAMGATAADPTWRMPFWEPYESMIEPGIADLDNAPKGGFAGSITAALFLRRFVTETESYTHFDIYGWQPSPAPGRPKGGSGQGARALLAALPARLGLL
ncbi:leucyl aminopeptidase family protein [Alphaproteobacteria bacterium KMM 3653]|uniref:Leucyl aminopeptidase family protein n=1 Tax=Harenicola maris TaxID=2841044 RepID=A0AAP2CRT4_9RHOB|nr:leucyl aminopeptidase family protein [Harenicola maris]